MRRSFLSPLASLFLLVAPLVAHAETKILTAEATYTMGDGETPSFAEAMALQKAKQMALEQAGTYVESYTKVQNLDLTTEEIQTIAGGVLQVEVLDKNRTLIGDGLRFFVKIKTTVTTDKMEELALHIKGKNVAGEYKKLQEEYARLSMEVESWKQLIAKTPAGPEREKALEQVRNRENAFMAVQRNEAALFQRLVSGSHLIAQGIEEQAVIESLLQTIIKKGHVIAVGEPKVLMVPSHSNVAKVVLPITLTVSDEVAPAARSAASTLGGIIHENQSLRMTASSDVLVGDKKYDPKSYLPVRVSLIRVAKNLELSRHFQERISNLALRLELVGNKTRLQECIIRHYAKDAFPLSGSREEKSAELLDEEIGSRNEGFEHMIKTGLIDDSGLVEGAGLYGADVAKSQARIRRREEITSLLHELRNEEIAAGLSEEQRIVITQRRELNRLASFIGLFIRVAPVHSRLRAGSLYGTGKASNPLSRRDEDNGFVAILHEPATFKLEFTLPQNVAEQLNSVNTQIVDVTDDQWEVMESERRCRVAR